MKYIPDESKKWRTLSSEYLFKRPWLTARRDTVELPDGRVNPEFYVLEYPSWINVIAITEDGKYVMVEQYRHGLARVGIELCAGVVEPGEAPEAAARRELEEETGSTLKPSLVRQTSFLLKSAPLRSASTLALHWS